MSHISVERNHVLGTSPADHVEKVSRYLETSVGHNRQDKTSHAPAEAESDSGDSLFLTQEPAPEAVRLKRRHRGSLWSKPISPGDLEESEDDAASSSSSSTFGREPEAVKRKRRKHSLRLPQFSFPFLTGRSRAQQNRVLHNSTMAGFFKCVREMCPGPYREGDSFSTLPTVDMDGENISPLSEEEDDWSESEDIKIVERRCFIVSSKTKHPQPWYVPEEGDGPVEQQRIERIACTPRRGRQRKTAAKTSTSRVTASSSDTENCDGRLSRKVLAVSEKNDEHVTSDTSILVQPETPRTKRWLARAIKKALVQKEEKNKDESTDSDDTFCESLETQRSPVKSTQTCIEASNVTELHVSVFHTDDLSQTSEVEDEPESQSLIQSLPGFVSDITDVTESERTGKKKEPSSLTAPHMDDDLELNEDACVDNSSHDDITLIQEKMLLSDSDTVNVTQEEGGNLETEERLEEDSVFSMTSESMNSGQEKKKKKKKKRERSVEEIQTNAVSKLLNNDAETLKKKKKMKKQKEVGAEVGVDLSSSNDVTLKESTGQSGGKKKKRESISEGVDVSCTPDKNDNVNNSESSQKTKEGHDEQDEVMTKKKKKKKKKRESISEGVDISCSLDKNVSNTDCSQKTIEGPDEQDEPLTKKKKKKKRESIREVDVTCPADENENISNVDCSQKIKEVPYEQDELVTKKKKKKSKIFCTNVSEDTVTQSDELVSVQKKEKRRTSSFLIADAEEKVARTPEEQSSPRSDSVAADFETESAETAGNLEASNDGVRKKKSKRKRKESVVQEKDGDQGFGEPNKTCQSTLSKTTDADIKKKKKRKKEDGELVTLVEKLDNSADVGYSQADEAVVLKKKKKKKKSKDMPDHVTPESPPTTTDAEPEGVSVETCSSVKLVEDEQASTSADTPATPVLNHVRDKKKKKKRKSN